MLMCIRWNAAGCLNVILFFNIRLNKSLPHRPISRFSLGYLQTEFCILLVLHVCYMSYLCRLKLPWMNPPDLVRREAENRNFSLYNFHHTPVTFPHLDLNILFSILLSNILNLYSSCSDILGLCSSPRAREQVWHPRETSMITKNCVV
jgi:hypothetical protein